MKKICILALVVYLPVLIAIGILALILMAFSWMFLRVKYDLTNSKAVIWLVQPLNDLYDVSFYNPKRK